MFKTFKVGELFDIHPTSAYKMRRTMSYSPPMEQRRFCPILP